MRTPHIRRIALLAAGLAAAGAAEAQLFKCVTAQGRTVYQDSACDDAAKQSTVRAPTPPSAPPPAPPTADGARQAPAAAPAAAATGNAIEIVALFAVCSERVPNFDRKYADSYQGWKMRNSAALDRLASEPDASRLDARLREERDRPATESIAERCADIATSIQAPRQAGAPITK